MPKDSEERANARKEEIVNACAALYEAMGYKDITIRDIGKKTSFTRTAIYHYFQTKEEIFLALLQREYEAWAADLEALAAQGGDLTPEAFAGAFAATLGRRGCMLKLMSMNLYDMEGNSRMENLVAFKRGLRRGAAGRRTLPGALFPPPGGARRAGIFIRLFPVPLRGLPLHLAHRKASRGDGAGRRAVLAVHRAGARAGIHRAGAAGAFSGTAS